MKGVILAGGTGSRLQPFTKYLNKHLLPIGPYPMIYWPLMKLKESGMRDILIITNEKDIDSFKGIVGDGNHLQMTISYQVQKQVGKGISDALLQAQDFIKQESFIVVLGDNIFEDDLSTYVKSFQSGREGAKVFLKEMNDVRQFGVPVINETTGTITSILEKPNNPDSNYCVTGIYLFDHKVFDYINQISLSLRNELEITDVLNIYIAKEELQYAILPGWWIDAGTHESLSRANQLVKDRNT